jgi:Ca2+-binding EF-hand superfamily protein
MDRPDALEQSIEAEEDESVSHFHVRLAEARKIAEHGESADQKAQAVKEAEEQQERIKEREREERKEAREAAREMEEVLRQLSELGSQGSAVEQHKLHHLLMPAAPVDVRVGKTDAECTEVFCGPGHLSWKEQQLPDHYEARFRAVPDVEHLALSKMTPHAREVYYVATKEEKEAMIASLHVALKPPWSSSDFMVSLQLRERALTKSELKKKALPAKLTTRSHLGAYLPVLLVKELNGGHYLYPKELHERTVFKQTLGGSYFIYYCQLDKVDEPEPEKREFWAVGSVLGQTGIRGVILRAYCTDKSPLTVPTGSWVGFDGASFVDQPLVSLVMEGADPPKGTQEPIILSKLEMDTEYEMQVRARNFYGIGEYGKTILFKTSTRPTPPPPPAHLEVENTGFGDMSVTITPADNDGGSPVTYWRVSCFLDEKLVSTVKVLPTYEQMIVEAVPVEVEVEGGEEDRRGSQGGRRTSHAAHQIMRAVPASHAEFRELKFGHVYAFTAYTCNAIGEGVTTDAVQVLVADDSNWFCGVCARMNIETAGYCKVCGTKADYDNAGAASGVGLAGLCTFPPQMQRLIDRIADGDRGILELPIDVAQVGTEGFVRLCNALNTANSAHDAHHNAAAALSGGYDEAHDTGGPVQSLRLFCSNRQASYSGAAMELVAGAEELATAWIDRTGGNHGPFAPAGAEEFEDVTVKSVVASSMETAVMAELDQQLKATQLELRGLGALTKVLQSTKSLTFLQIVNCGLNDDVASMLSLVLWDNTTITCVDLSHNVLTDEGFRAIGEGLGTAVNCTLTSLDLSHNKIELGGAGVIDVDAFAAQFAAEDVDGDGTVTLEELKAFRKRLEGDQYDERAAETDFSKYDVNGDGSMTLDEYLESARATAIDVFAREFRENDLDGDGAVTLAELKAFRKRVEGDHFDEEAVEKDFKRFDINGDGSMDLEEYLENARDAAHIRYILQNSSTLTELKLDHNRIGDDGAGSIAKGLLPNPKVAELQHLLQPGGHSGGAEDLLDDPEEVRRYRAALMHHRPAHSLLGAPGLVNLSLAGTRVGLEGFLELGHALRFNRTIRKLKLEVNGAKLGAVLQLLPRLYDESDGHVHSTDDCLTQVEFEGEPIADIGVSALSHGLRNNRMVLRVKLDNVRATDRSTTELAQCLAVNSTLTSVSLCQNSLGDISAIALANAMRQNDTLCTLRLSGNCISDRGAEAWADLLRSGKVGNITPAAALANLDFHLNKISEDLMNKLDFLVLHRPTLKALALAIEEGANELHHGDYYNYDEDDGDGDSDDDEVFNVQLSGQNMGLLEMEELVLAMGVSARTTSAMADTLGKGAPGGRFKVLTAVLDLSANHEIGPQQGLRLLMPLLTPVPIQPFDTASVDPTYAAALYGEGCCFRLVSLDLNGAGLDDSAVMLITTAMLSGGDAQAEAKAEAKATAVELGREVGEGGSDDESNAVGVVLLRSLFLRANHISDAGAETLATALALPQCRRLGTLSLQDNDIGDKGAVALLRLLQKRCSHSGIVEGNDAAGASRRRRTRAAKRAKRRRQQQEDEAQEMEERPHKTPLHSPHGGLRRHSARHGAEEEEEEEEEEWEWCPSPPKGSHLVAHAHLNADAVTEQELETLAKQQLAALDASESGGGAAGEGSVSGSDCEVRVCEGDDDDDDDEEDRFPAALKISLAGNRRVSEELGLLFAELQAMPSRKLAKMMSVMAKMQSVQREDCVHTDVSGMEGPRVLGGHLPAAGQGREAMRAEVDVELIAAAASEQELELVAAQQLLRTLSMISGGDHHGSGSRDADGRDGSNGSTGGDGSNGSTGGGGGGDNGKTGGSVRLCPCRRLWLDLANCCLGDKGAHLLSEAVIAGVQQILSNVAGVQQILSNVAAPHMRANLPDSELVLMLSVDASRNKLTDDGVRALVGALRAAVVAVDPPRAGTLDERISSLMGGDASSLMGGDAAGRPSKTTVLLSLDISNNTRVTDASVSSLVRLVEDSAESITASMAVRENPHCVVLVLRTLGIASCSIGSNGRSDLQAALTRASSALGTAGADVGHSVASLMPVVRFGEEGSNFNSHAHASESSLYGATKPGEREIHTTAEPPKAKEELIQQSEDHAEAKLASLLRQSKSDGSGGGALLPLPASHVEQQRWVQRWERDRRDEEARLAAIARARAPPPTLTLLYTDPNIASGNQEQPQPQEMASVAVLTPQKMRAASALSSVVLSPAQREAKTKFRAQARAQAVVAQCAGEFIRLDGGAGGADAVVVDAITAALSVAGGITSSRISAARSYAAHAGVAVAKAVKKQKQSTASASTIVYMRKRPLADGILDLAARGAYLYLYFSKNAAVPTPALDQILPSNGSSSNGSKRGKQTRSRGGCSLQRGGAAMAVGASKGGVWYIGTLRRHGGEGASRTAGKKPKYAVTPVLWAPVPPSFAASTPASSTGLLPLPLGAGESSQSESAWHAVILSANKPSKAAPEDLRWEKVPGAVLVGGGVMELGAIAARRRAGGGGMEEQALAADIASSAAVVAAERAKAAMWRAIESVDEAKEAAARDKRKKAQLLPGIGNAQSPAATKKKKKKPKKGGNEGGGVGGSTTSAISFVERLPVLQGLTGPGRDDAGLSLILRSLSIADKQPDPKEDSQGGRRKTSAR